MDDFPQYIEYVESLERCAESGWYAFDFILSASMNESYIRELKQIGGTFLFLTMLRKPFFKLESDDYIIKGVAGDDFFRMAVHESKVKELKRVEKYLISIYRKNKLEIL